MPHQIYLEMETCCNCGIPFGITSDRMKVLRERGGDFYCTNGHSQRYTETDNMRLKKQLRNVNQQLEWSETNLQSEKDSHRATRGVVTKIKKRTGNGECPCCNRSFQNLRRHMGTKHPDFKEEKSA